MNIREKLTQRFLRDKGYLVQTVVKPSRMHMQHDYFGLFDHIVVRGNTVDNMMPYVFFVQTKSRKIYGRAKEPYKSFPIQSYCFVWTKNSSNRWELTVQDFKYNCIKNNEDF